MISRLFFTDDNIFFTEKVHEEGVRIKKFVDEYCKPQVVRLLQSLSCCAGA